MARTQNWICCQLGAREHYSFPRALHARGMLVGLVTDAWVPPGSRFGAFNRHLRERFHPGLVDASVKSWNSGLLAFELGARAKRLSGWPLILARNRWFQKKAVKVLSKLSSAHLPSPISNQTVFAYSYAALEIFRFAKARGWRTVLGQIDPGPIEERLVARLHSEAGCGASEWTPAPVDYWQSWREECALADRVVVNSRWSREALTSEGVSGERIAVIPLAYAPSAEADGFSRDYPAAFTTERPLRVLFLGQVNIRKGLLPLLDAVRMLAKEPVELWIVGPVQMTVPPDLQNNPNVRWLGNVSRAETADFYRRADVFVFPTFSDGFGLTQLEAQAWHLPIIASRFCGDVVEDGDNGLLLPEIAAHAITKVLRELINNPVRLREFSARSGANEKYSLNNLAAALVKL